jgi:mono/diheme cytochrome c family protein
MRTFLAGVMFCVLLLLSGAYLVAGTGRFDVGATAPAGLIERVAPRVRDLSIARRAEALAQPIPRDAKAQARGLSHYAENCLPCHGAPGVPPPEFQKGMNPLPPSIESPMVQNYTDAQLFWIVRNGVRMTGMPAFSVNHKDDEIRDIVAFVRHVPQLTDAERARLKLAQPEGNHHHHEGGEGEEHHHEGDEHHEGAI